MLLSALLEDAGNGIDLTARYQHWNKLLFDDKLPDIPVIWAVLKGVGGVADAKMKVDPSKPSPNRLRVRMGLEDKYSDHFIIPGTMRIRMSSLYRRSQEAIDKVLIHEMIHILMMTTGHLGQGHGTLFERERLRLSRLAGFEIPRKDSIEDKEFAVEVKVKPCGVILVTDKQGGHLYAMVVPQLLEGAIEAIEQRFAYFVKYNYWKAGYAYVVNDQRWSEQAKKTIVQRVPFGPKTRFFRLADQSAIDDLHQNGKLLVKVGDEG